VRLVFKAMLALNGATRAAGINLGPMLFRRVHKGLGGRMRLMVAGGSRFDPAIGHQLYRLGFDIIQGYGLTETSGAATLTRPGDRALETVGQPLPGNHVRIAATASSEDGNGDGEVLIAGPIVMQGYYNRPDATAAALRDGWLWTGDLGRLDARGRLTITGRKKEIIVLSSGKNIYPEEIEAVYRKSAFISEICVLGLARAEEPSAERLYAVVVPDEQKLRERKIANVGDIIRFEMEGASVDLPHHKRVLGYEIWFEPLPRTSTGKIKRFEVQRRVSEVTAAKREPGAALSEEDKAFLERPELSAILAVIKGAVKGGALVTPDANLELDLGLDSMERVELLTALEQQAGASIPEEELQRLYTVRELAESLIAHARDDQSRAAPASWGTLLSTDAADQAAFRQWLQPHWLVPALVYFGFRALRVLLRPGLKVRLSGTERFPGRGPYLICPNHQSYLDPFFVVVALPFRLARQVFFVGATEYFETPLTRWLARQVNLVPVDPDAALVSAMQAGAAGLREGRVLVLFPEGERSIDGDVRTFKKGAAILAHHLQVPIVPVAVRGAFELWPRNRPLNWRALLPGAGSRVSVAVGAPIAPDQDGNVEMAYETLTGRVRGAVSALYDGSPR
jgi:long-chain acyl-CoA synthetase